MRTLAGAMTAAGVGTLALCEMHLARTGSLDDALAERMAASRERGLVWFESNFSVDTNPRNGRPSPPANKCFTSNLKWAWKKRIFMPAKSWRVI